jgi:hypothetical protein
MIRPASSSDVRAELWGSFVSLLKSYAAAASLHGTEHGVLVLSENTLNIFAARGTLKINYHPMIGRGVWSLFHGTDRHQDAVQPEQLDQGKFDLNLDGTITLDDNTVEMDLAAIQLIAALTHAASRDEIEVPA